MENKEWINKNKKLFDGIKQGVIYIVFENEKPMPLREAGKARHKSLYKQDRTGKVVIRTTSRVSKNGNPFVTKICLCKHCGEMREAKRIRKAICARCLKAEHNGKCLANHYRRKKSPVKKKIKQAKKKVSKITAKETAYKITGDYQKVNDFNIVQLGDDYFDDKWRERLEGEVA